MLFVATIAIAMHWCACGADTGDRAIKSCTTKINRWFDKSDIKDVPYATLGDKRMIKFQRLLEKTKVVFERVKRDQIDATQDCFTEACSKLALSAAQNNDVSLLLGISSTFPMNYLSLIKGKVEVGTTGYEGYRCMADVSVLHVFLNDPLRFADLNAVLTANERPLLYELVLTTNSNSAKFLIDDITKRRTITDLLNSGKNKLFQDLIELQMKYTLLNPVDLVHFNYLAGIFPLKVEWDSFNNLNLLDNVAEQHDSHESILDFIFVTSLGSKSNFEVRNFAICAAVATNNRLDLNTIFDSALKYKIVGDELYLSALSYSLKYQNGKLANEFAAKITDKVMRLLYYGDLIAFLVDNPVMVPILDKQLVDFFVGLQRTEPVARSLIKSLGLLKSKLPVVASQPKKSHRFHLHKSHREESKKEKRSLEMQPRIDPLEIRLRLILKSIVVIECFMKSTDDENFVKLSQRYLEQVEILLTQPNRIQLILDLSSKIYNAE